MAELAGIRQSIDRAWRLLSETGFMDMAMEMYTDAYRSRVHAAVTELREAVRALVRRNNRDAYGEMSAARRITLWKAILRARAPTTGIYLMGQLGARYPGMTAELETATNDLARLPAVGTTAELRRMSQRIREAMPGRRNAVEEEAARQGDPMPRGITSEEAALYQRIVFRAMRRSERESHSYRNAGDAAIGAFGESFLPAMPGQNTQGFVQDQVEGRFTEMAVGAQRANAVGATVSLIRGVLSAIDAHGRATNSTYRLNYWIHQGCLEESGGDASAAMQLGRQLQTIRQRMNAWLAWLERHQDHPSFVPPSGRIDAAPTASNDRGTNSRSPAGNRRWPVQSSLHTAAVRGPEGLA